LAIEQIGADLVKPSVKEFVDLQLAVAEFRSNLFQKDMDCVFGQSHNPGGDLDRALVAHDAEGPRQHMRTVRVQNDRAALYVDWSH
jgi:hypothetical protein